MTADGPGWIDVHGHFYLPEGQEDKDAKWQAMRDGQFLVPKSGVYWSETDTLAYLDKANIQMQLLSYIPTSVEALIMANDYGASLVKRNPTRFGLLAALPTDSPDAALKEIERAYSTLHADGFAVSCVYNDIYLGDRIVEPILAELDRRRATVFTHPNAYAPAHRGRPSPLIEVAFETARVITDMLYASTFTKFPNIRWIISHCGGALPALSGRLKLLGGEQWVPNRNSVTTDLISEQLAKLYVDTAATGSVETIAPAIAMTGKHHLVYGSDCGVPCSSERTIEQNRRNVMKVGLLSLEEVEALGSRAFELFPDALKRIKEA